MNIGYILTFPSRPPLPGSDHSINDLRQTVITLIDGSAHLPIPGDLSTQDKEGFHLTFTFDWNVTSLF